MNNKEYEYSFKVNSLDPYINYCKDNNYEFIKKTNQTRTLYKNENKTNARITIETINGETKKTLDFKDDVNSDEVLIIRRETNALEFTSVETVLSILDFLGYKEHTILKRTRTVYKLNNVKFELDDYESPEVSKVVAIEGLKEEVDKVYEEVKTKIEE